MDFGLSKMLTNSKFYDQDGTPEYMAPEMFGKDGHDHRIDWWALGVLTYELLTTCSPFTQANGNNNKKSIKCRILKVQYPMPACSEDAQKLIKGLLEKEPSKRLGMLSML